MSIIRVLDEHTINQIKAGEVVENPACVIKELVENSIDAQSTHIIIETLSAGRQLIRITDNGVGMSADDALLSIERHATSKISSTTDLETLSTMGFRGEALASIAAVSKLKILTCQQDASATLVVVEGGRLLQTSQTHAARGTTIEVKSLFYNVPARRKFQKSLSRDNMEIVKTVTALAIGHPEIHFQLTCNEKLVFKSHSEELQLRILDVLGKEFTDELTSLSFQHDEIRITGMVSLPSATRPNRSGQYLFINKRFVTCPSISYAVLEGYGTLLSKGRYPSYVLHIEIPAHLVDPNVHPQKKEIRLHGESLLRHAVTKAIESTLHKENAVPALPWEKLTFAPPEPSIVNSIFAIRPAPTVQQTLFISFNIIGIWPPYIIVEASSMQEILLKKLKTPAEGLFFINQRLAYKRIMYEDLSKKEHAHTVQDLLIPLQFEFSAAESLILKERIEELCSLGIVLRPFGPSTFIVDALSAHIPENEVESLLHAALHEAPLTLEVARVISKKAPALNQFEAHALLEKWVHCAHPEYCPDGNSVLLQFNPK